jgi:ABC-2 type transport system permease protein
MLRAGTVQFVLTIPEAFGERILRGERPVLLLEADATDPAATSNAVNAFKEAVRLAVDRELAGSFAQLQSGTWPVDVRIHADYNPEAVTQYNIVPGLMGTIMTMTLVMITALAITRETERGTMENLLSTPVSPLEVMIGKILPYILVGYIQMTLIIIATRFLFEVPMHGSLTLIYVLSLFFIAANLTIGVTFSTLARNQLQALQMSIFFFMPSMLLTGFMFPFRGMPVWARVLGETLPLTHYLRLVRGILLKGDGLTQAMGHVWPMILIWAVAVALGARFYRKTLD